MNLKEVAKINISNSEKGERNLKGNLKQMINKINVDDSNRGKEDMDVMIGLINKQRKKDGEEPLSLKELIKIVNET